MGRRDHTMPWVENCAHVHVRVRAHASQVLSSAHDYTVPHKITSHNIHHITHHTSHHTTHHKHTTHVCSSTYPTRNARIIAHDAVQSVGGLSPLSQLARSLEESSASAPRRGERGAGSTVLGDSARTLHRASTTERMWPTS